MKLRTLFFLTHGVSAALVAALTIGAFPLSNPLYIGVAATMSLATVCAATLFATRRIKAGLSVLESVVVNNQNLDDLRGATVEFDRAGQVIGQQATCWESVAADTRRQAQQFQSMIQSLDRRGAGVEPTFDQLRIVLSGMGETLQVQLGQLGHGTGEVEQRVKAITEGTEAQGNAVVKTTAYVEQLSATIEDVSNNANLANSAISGTGQTATESLRSISELVDGLSRIRAQSQTCENKLQGLRDPAKQVSAIVDTIGDMAARTDLLALNASIESIRAGEHGRGFAMVAEEVRALAEQASDATREIASLMDSLQLVNQESVGIIERQREQIESEVQRARTVESCLTDICQNWTKDSRHIEQIAASSARQLQLAQDVVLAVEEISQFAKTNRKNAESVGWTMKSISQSTPEVTNAVQRLKNCGGEQADNGAHEEELETVIDGQDPSHVPTGLIDVPSTSIDPALVG